MASRTDSQFPRRGAGGGGVEKVKHSGRVPFCLDCCWVGSLDKVLGRQGFFVHCNPRVKLLLELTAAKLSGYTFHLG